VSFKTTIGDYEVSTVKTFDHGWETMVFNNRNGDTDTHPKFYRRHVNSAEAFDWHTMVVERMRNTNEPERTSEAR